jgi:hypothetical protein
MKAEKKQRRPSCSTDGICRPHRGPEKPAAAKKGKDASMAGVNKNVLLNKVNLLIAGLNKNFTAKNSITVGGTSMTLAQILAQLAPLATLEQNAVDTKNAWEAAVAAKKSGLPPIEKFVGLLIAALKNTLGPESPLLASFGIATPKPKAPRSSVQKAVSTALAANTRVVRGTKSAKQKQSISAAGKPGVTVVGPSGEPLLTVAAVPPGSGATQTVVIGAAAGAPGANSGASTAAPTPSSTVTGK